MVSRSNLALSPSKLHLLDRDQVQPVGMSSPPSFPYLSPKSRRESPPSISTSSSLVSLSVSEKYHISPDPAFWGSTTEGPEPDDHLHLPDPKRDARRDLARDFFTKRGIQNVGCLAILVLLLIALFAVYPLLSYFVRPSPNTLGGYGLGGINGTGQVPDLPFGLIDPDTPAEALRRTGFDGREMELVFSDEFEVEGRSFYKGDDPYWEAEDIHYWQTSNLEWYDPRQITTTEGKLAITLSDTPSHGLNYTGGLLMSWNKFCFTGGYLSASISLPGHPDVAGLWPAFWSLGNLGRAGYGATLEGMWPYTYDSCDVGTLPNQTLDGKPEVALTSGKIYSDYELSYLPGQRLSRCTCDDPESFHPGPKDANGDYVGRGAPEIDVLEATVEQNLRLGQLSQSGQWAPFNAYYEWTNTSETYTLHDEDYEWPTHLNEYTGGEFQQASSGIATANQSCYSGANPTPSSGCYSEYGFEYVTGPDGYIGWVADGRRTWTVKAAGLGPDPRVEIDTRPIPTEPMYMLCAAEFGYINWDELSWPAVMYVDWVRASPGPAVYQPVDAKNIGCDPPDRPTAAYIERFPEAYINPNLTTWVNDYGLAFPKNRLVDDC